MPSVPPAAPAVARENQEQPQAVGEREQEVGERRREEPDEEQAPAADPVGEPSPDRGRHELRDGKRRDDEGDPARRGSQFLGVEREQREDDPEAHHVHHHRPEQDAEPGASQHAVVVVIPCFKPIFSSSERAPRASAGASTATFHVREDAVVTTPRTIFAFAVRSGADPVGELTVRRV